MDNLDPDLKGVFDKLGLSEKELQDKDTAKFIYDFIENHGGIEAVKEHQRQQLHPMVNTRSVGPPQPPSSVGHAQHLPPAPHAVQAGMFHYYAISNSYNSNLKSWSDAVFV